MDLPSYSCGDSRTKQFKLSGSLLIVISWLAATYARF